MPAWIAKILESILYKWLSKLGSALVQYFKNIIDKEKRAKEQKEALAKYKEAFDNNLSEEEKIKRGEDLLNSGSKP